MPSRVIIRSVKAKTPRNAPIPVLIRRGLEPPFDVPLDVPAGPPHVDDERADQSGRDQGQDALPERLIGGPGEEDARDDADDDRRDDAPVHRRDQAVPTRFSEVGEADGHDEERFQPFPQRHDERLQHDESLRRPMARESETDLVLESVHGDIRPVKSGIDWLEALGSKALARAFEYSVRRFCQSLKPRAESLA